MRSVVFLLVLAGLGYGVFRACGRKASDVPDETTPAVNAAEVPAAPPPESGGASTPLGTLAEPVQRAVERVAQSGALGDLAADLGRIEKEGSERDRAIAGLLVGACDDQDPLRRWISLSRLAADTSFAAKAREEYSTRAVEAAKDGVRKGPVARVRVVKGDSLAKICKRAAKDLQLNLTPGMLRWVNGIPGDRIKPDQELILPKGDLRVEVSKRRFRIDLWLGDGLVRSYPVALGREDKTPVLDFVVESKLEKPPWDDPTTGKRLHYGQPGYALGTRWLGFNDAEGHAGLGIHGTDDPNSIGTNASLGCVRLRNEDVEALFELVPLKTRVAIRP